MVYVWRNPTLRGLGFATVASWRPSAPRQTSWRTLPVAGDGVPVHILYWTAFADPAGGLQFRREPAEVARVLRALEGRFAQRFDAAHRR